MPDNVIKPEGYSALGTYAKTFRGGYAEFDVGVQSGLCLFALREDMDFAALEAILERIVQAMPAIKRIFSAPIIRLRDTAEILPAEAVRVVNSKTLAHISVHSELWSNIKEDRLIPRKLMSIRQDDDYAIYENIVFARTVDAILNFTARNLRVLRDMMYANRELSFNLLERENHPSYYLALGKLHTGYLRDYDKYLLPIEKCYRMLSSIERSLISRLSLPVYQKCRKKKMNLGLKKTNIFRSHKDYRRLYSLVKYFSEIGINTLSTEDDTVPEEDYSSFCAMLCVFAAGHFNFRFEAGVKLDFTRINADARFGEWVLNVRAQNGGILLTVTKDTTYRVFLCLPNAAPAEAEETVRVSADGDECVRLSLYDIDSFRRIQQMLQRAMIYADAAHDACPFCGKQLSLSDDGAYECGACRTVIETVESPEGEKYYRTGIKYFRKPKLPSDRRELEGLYYYRNITLIGEDGELA
jgi:hypothetical protein